jgi:hypothetical protein
MGCQLEILFGTRAFAHGKCKDSQFDLQRAAEVFTL